MSKFSAQDYNFVAKRLRENFPIAPFVEANDPDLKKGLNYARGWVCNLALDFAKKYLEDNPNFDPLAFLDRCSPDPDLYPLSQLWEDRGEKSN